MVFVHNAQPTIISMLMESAVKLVPNAMFSTDKLESAKAAMKDIQL